MQRASIAGLLMVVALAVVACGDDATRRTDSPRTVVADTAAPTDPYTRDSSGRITKADVDVTITCPNGGVSAHIRPWKITVDPGAAVEWHVHGGNVDSVIIRQKPADGGAWVLSVSPPYRRKGPGSIAGGSAIATPKADTARYEVEFVCTDGTEQYRGLIDPDLIISGGNKHDSTTSTT